MLIKESKTAIIAGGGELVISYLKLVKNKKKNNYILIGIKNFFLSSKYKCNFLLDFNNIGDIFNILYKENVTDIIFLGSISKPSIFTFRPNLNTIYKKLEVSWLFYSDYL